MELARREQESGITLMTVNPGMAWTPSTEALTPKAVPAWRLMWPLVRWFQRRASPEKAANAPIAAASGDLSTGEYTYINEKGKPESLAKNATDPSLPQRSWELAESLVAGAPTAGTRA